MSRTILSLEITDAIIFYWATETYINEYSYDSNFLDFYQNLGWDLQYTNNLNFLSIAEHQAAFFILTYASRS
jgi:hypothetical protein